jgi:E3 ubiquitin-protein ligase makorin
MQQLEADMEHAFAMAKSKDKTCGICMEVVVEKQKSEARDQRYKSFGTLIWK